MISILAVRRFQNRQLCDSRKAKQFSNGALNRKLRSLLPRPRFHTKPRQHQKVTFLLMAKYPGYMGLLDMGLGKTWCILNLIVWWMTTGKVKRTLVLVPNTANIQGWIDEARIHAPKLRVVGLDQSTRQGRIDALMSDSDVVVATYMGWCSLITTSVPTKKKNKKKWKIHAPTENRYLKMFQGAAYDEITAVMHKESLFSRSVFHISRRTKFHYGLTGTPFGKNPEAMWSQFYATDLGETLGPTLGLLRGAFFKEVESEWSAFPDYVFDKRKKGELARMIRHRSIRYKDTECQDLPPMVPIIKHVHFPDENAQYQKKMIKQIRESDGNRDVVENSWHHLRRLASGYMSIKFPDGNRSEVVFSSNPKLDLMVQDIKELPEGRKAIVFLDYVKSGDLVCKRLEAEGIKFVRLYGKTPNKGKVLTKFKTDPSVKVMVSSSSGALGHNLQVANYVMMYESPSSPITRSQMEKRAHRDGQLHKVFVIDYIVAGSIEVKIKRSLVEGRDLFNDVVEDPTNFSLKGALYAEDGMGNQVRRVVAA